MNRLREDVFAKVEYVRKLGEEMARFAAHTVATSGRFVGDDHQERMLDERERIRSMMKSLGIEDSRIAEVLDQIDRTVAIDMKEKVVAAVGKIHKLDQKAYEQLVHELRKQLRGYSSSASHDDLVAFLKERRVYDQSVDKAIDQLDLFLREKHL
jgi:SOS response regulatory protein OraA/RecX